MSPDFDRNITRIIKGELQYVSKDALGLNLLISKIKKQYALNPTSGELAKCKKESEDFLSKYIQIMKKDISVIESL